MKTSVPSVIIIGGGITGLAAAFRLKMLSRQSGRRLEIKVFEQSQCFGGKIRTEREGGFTFEGGPDIMLARKPRGIGLCHELGLGEHVLPTNPYFRRSYIRKKARLLPFPEGLSGLIPTRFGPLFRSPLLSIPGKLRIGLDRFIPARRSVEEESIAEFVSRRLGREAYEKLVAPLLGGIYGGNGNRLSLQATFPHLRNLEQQYGSLIRGLLARKQAGASTNDTTAFVTLAGGMQELIDSLCSHLVDVKMNAECPVSVVKKHGDRFQIAASDGQHEADAVIITSPAFVSGKMISTIDESLSRELLGIPYASCVTLSLAYRKIDVSRPLDAYGYLVPESEAGDVLACTWTSTKVPARAPADGILFRIFFGQTDRADSTGENDDSLLAKARSELSATLGISRPPIHYRLFRWKRAMPQYEMGHPARLARISQLLAHHPGLFLAGAAFHGVGIPDCIADGEQAASCAFDQLFKEETVSQF